MDVSQDDSEEWNQWLGKNFSPSEKIKYLWDKHMILDKMSNFNNILYLFIIILTSIRLLYM